MSRDKMKNVPLSHESGFAYSENLILTFLSSLK